MVKNERQLIETLDENGNVINFELYDIVEVEGREYALLIPADTDDSEEEVLLMRISLEGEEYILERIEDDAEFDKVAEYIESMHEEE